MVRLDHPLKKGSKMPLFILLFVVSLVFKRIGKTKAYFQRFKALLMMRNLLNFFREYFRGGGGSSLVKSGVGSKKNF